MMYRQRMKKPLTYPSVSPVASVLQDRSSEPSDGVSKGYGAMVRTQIYLTRHEHEFVSAESRRRGEPMAAVIRAFIDDKMRLPDAAWERNPMLETSPEDPDLDLPEDAAINHDHYLYGAPKKYVKNRGKWVFTKIVPSSQG